MQGCFFFLADFGTVGNYLSRITLTPSRDFVFPPSEGREPVAVCEFPGGNTKSRLGVKVIRDKFGCRSEMGKKSTLVLGVCVCVCGF